jgi:folate-binding protein YgfZ
LPTAITVPDGIDAGIAWHFGDPLGEQRILHKSAGIIDRSNRGVLMVTGADRLPWLHSIISQHVANLADGESTQTLVLSPHGHVEQHWQLTELAGTVWLDVEPGQAGEALAYLEKMRFLKRVEPVDVSAAWAVLTLSGPSTTQVLELAAFPVPAVSQAIALDGGGFIRGMRADPKSKTIVVDLLVPRKSAADVVVRLQEAGARPVGTWAFDAVRVQSREPRLRFETDHRTIPHEVGWIGSAVHLDKGCYRGQETVARVHNLGKPPRRLVLLYLDGLSDVLPEAGTPVEFGGRAVGFLGTAVQHYELGPIGLAVIKRSIPDDAELTVAGHLVTIDTEGSGGPDGTDVTDVSDVAH